LLSGGCLNIALAGDLPPPPKNINEIRVC